MVARPCPSTAPPRLRGRSRCLFGCSRAVSSRRASRPMSPVRVSFVRGERLFAASVARRLRAPDRYAAMLAGPVSGVPCLFGQVLGLRDERPASPRQLARPAELSARAPRPPSSEGFLKRRQSAPPRSGARTRLNVRPSPATNPPPPCIDLSPPATQTGCHSRRAHLVRGERRIRRSGHASSARIDLLSPQMIFEGGDFVVARVGDGPRAKAWETLRGASAWAGGSARRCDPDGAR